MILAVESKLTSSTTTPTRNSRSSKIASNHLHVNQRNRRQLAHCVAKRVLRHLEVPGLNVREVETCASSPTKRDKGNYESKIDGDRFDGVNDGEVEAPELE